MKQMKVIFIVDDSMLYLMAAQKALEDTYKVVALSSAAAMFETLNTVKPDLIVLDIIMPDMDGLEALRKLKANVRYASIPVIFLTGKKDDVTEALGFELGAVDFITKPFSKSVFINRIKTHLDIEDIIRERTERLLKLQGGLVSILANMVENRDTLTGKHIERTTKYMEVLLEAMFEQGAYATELSTWDFESTIWSARLHDIGKIAVTDLILNKPEQLTDKEFSIMKTHTVEGERLIDAVIKESGDVPFLQNAKLFAGSHHERWDGTGYPRGLKGAAIPLQGRIMAIADVYDALVSERPYKSAFSHEKAVDIILESSGTNFDPQIVDVFYKVHSLFEGASEMELNIAAPNSLPGI